MEKHNTKKPVLVIMAAGMGSRYGGLKQIDPIDGEGHIIMDYSLYDAVLAGFEEVIFIIKRQNEASFKEAIGNRMKQHIKVNYVFQDLLLPEGFEVPEGREKPFGTGHAVLSCLGTVEAPFAVINADDYYGRNAFAQIYQYLSTHKDDEKYRYTMVGYQLKNTMTENGYVARGICEADEESHLTAITERTHIQWKDGVPAFTEDNGAAWQELSPESIVSMNMWGFTESILGELKERFPVFLTENLPKNPMKCEFFLPMVVGELLAEDKAVVEVLQSKDRWYGVTYQEDKQMVMNAVAQMKKQGLYPKNLWG